MIQNYAQACAVLGVERGAAADEIKSAYRRLSKQLHPDAHPAQGEMERQAYLLVTEAYDYITQHAPEAAVPVAARVMGSPIGSYTSTAERAASRRRFDEEYRKRQLAHKEKLKEELKERQEDMARARREREILNEIRMIRLAAAINAAISAEAAK